MPCPHHRSTEDDDHGIDRREFMKAALVIGGTSALTAAKARAHGGDHGEPAPGTDDRSSLPDRQFAWNDFVPPNELTGEAKTPNHHLMLLLEYTSDGTPTDDDREQVEAALRTLERAFKWGNEGILFTIGYSNKYFDRYDEDLPDDTGLRPPEDVIEASDIARSGNVKADQADAHLHMASKHAPALLEAEQALLGNVETVNGTNVEATLEDIFEQTDRRTGFIGNPHEQWDDEIQGENRIPEGAPVWFGYKSLFSDSQPSEDVVAISDDDHPFYDGTTEQASVLLDDDIRGWHDEFDDGEQVARMFSPHHTPEDTGEFGRELAPTSGTENRREDGSTMNEIAALTKDDADGQRVVGHTQKLARARKGPDNTPPLLRRDFPSTDSDRVHTQFISNQRTIDEFIDVRRAMAFVNNDEEDPNAQSEVPIKDHGIQGHFKVKRRGTFLIPPRDLRALPPVEPPDDDGDGHADEDDEDNDRFDDDDGDDDEDSFDDD